MPKHSIGVTLLPDYGMGGIYTRYYDHLGFYGSYGHTIAGFSARRFDTAQKIAIGTQYLIFNANTSYPSWFSAGVSYNTYKGMDANYAKVKYASQPWDCQLGFGLMIQLIDVGFRYDLLKNEGQLDILINFGHRLIKQKHLRYRHY